MGVGAQYDHENKRSMDDSWTWIEGAKDNKWFPLYCYRESDELRIQAVYRHLKARVAGGQTVDDFSDFRIHPAGVWMNSEMSLSEIRSDIGADNLARILKTFNQPKRCGVARGSTGEVCVRKPNHEGKHSPRPDMEGK